MTGIPLPTGPRNRFPGDLLVQLRFDTLGFLTRIARQHGDFVPFKPWNWPYILVNDPDAIREVLVTKSDQFIKGPALRRATDTLGQGLLTSEGDFHRRQRRLSQPAFHAQRVATYADAMVAVAARSIDAWEDGQEVDVHEQMMQTTLRIVAKTLFDADVERDVRAIGHAMDVSVNMFTRAMAPWAGLLNVLPLPSNFRFRKARAVLNETIDRFIAERRAEPAGTDRGDLLSMLLMVQAVQPASTSASVAGLGEAPSSQSAKQAERPALDAAEQGGKPTPQEWMSDLQLRSELLTLFTAGHETTANALTFTLYLLAKHPAVESRLHAELDVALAGRAPRAADLDALPYARAVVAESMRLYPPAWTVSREATRDVEIAGRAIPEKAVLLMSQWVTHRDARWWPEPERFDPDRWLPGGSATAPDRPKYAYYPFGGGPRNCIGESFAWTEAILVLALICQRWRAALIDPAAPLELTATITLRPTHGIPMRLDRRKNIARSSM